MSKQNVYENICKKCYIKVNKLTKKEVSKIVLTEYKEQCDCCKRRDFLVDFVEDYYE